MIHEPAFWSKVNTEDSDPQGFSTLRNDTRIASATEDFYLSIKQL
jgi:hypothetical protein